MIANYLIFFLWLVTATKAYEDGDEYCDDTGCYPVVCDDECYFHVDVEVIKEHI